MRLGCFVQNHTDDEYVPLGTSRVINGLRHNCDLLPEGKIRYTISREFVRLCRRG